MRHSSEPSLLCADHRTKLSSRVTTDGDGGIVELIEPCRECRRPRFVVRNGNGQAPKPKQPPKPKEPVVRLLVCEDCSRQWERPAQPGRLPKKCERCRG